MPIRVPSARFLLPAILALLVSLPVSASRAAVPGSLFMQVSSGQGQGYVIKVQGVREGDAFLVDVGSMARALRLKHTFNGVSMRVDDSLDRPASSLLLTPGNTFAVAAGPSAEAGRRILQLGAAPVVRQGALFLPVRQAARMFSLWLDRDVTFEAPTGRVRASFQRRDPSSSFRSIGLVQPDSSDTGTLPPQPAEPQAGPTVIDEIRVDAMANGLVVRLDASGSPSTASFVRPDANGIAYLTVDRATGNLPLLAKRYATGAVRSITPVQLQSGALQFAVALNTDAIALKSSSFVRDAKNNDYVFYVMSDVNVEAIRRAEKERQNQRRLSRDVSKWRLDAIVIDAGHGGKDPGAIGQRGTREKDVVLNIATDLGMFIRQKWPDVSVIYTRRDDRFIPLNDRGRIANRSGGKLFVSIHCNSAPRNTVRGAEVYILGPHKTQSALDVAMMENSVITKEENYRESYKGFSDEYLIMSSMAQSAFAMQSTELAQDVLRRIERSGSNNGLGVRQAGFMVLWTPSMPSVLVEAGYLSNPDEEKALRDREEQTKIAYGIFQGLQQYRTTYESRLAASSSAE